MTTTEAGEEIEEHGIAMDEEKKRVRCKYCAKEVRGFNRLKHHLGAVGSDVTACTEVPADVKERMREALLEKKKERLLKEVGEIYHPDLPLKRNLSPASREPRRCQLKLTQLSTSDKGKKAADVQVEGANGSSCHLKPFKPTYLGRGKKVPVPSSAEGTNGCITCISEDAHTVVKEEVKNESVLFVSRCIGNFFYEAGIDLAGIKLPSFQRMLDAVHGCGTEYKVPTYNELQGWILQQEVKEVLCHVEVIKHSWGRSGCSILLDGWTDQMGRNLLRFLVDCPQGTIFLRSVDVSDAVQDVDALFLLLSKVIDEVGAQSVVQVVAHDASCYMEAVGKKLVEKYRSIFWTLSADYCINLILEKIGLMDHVKKVLADAKTITRFIYSHALPLELMRKHIQGRDLVKSSNLKSVASFITLKNMISEKENLVNMFNSPMWHASIWASRTKGNYISELVKGPLFWSAAADILKVTNPLLGVLYQINRGDEAPMGFLYDAMDRAKEEIRTNLGGEEATYLPFWSTIDCIWDNCLHSPIHSAAYFLNPKLFYSSDFFVDAEVTNGLLCCIVRLVEDQHDQELIVLQLDAYREASGGFAKEKAVDQRAQIPPALWWSLYGEQSPELQRLAIKILSQTCCGSAKYKLRKGLSEQLHAERRNFIEQQRFRDMEFIHNNRRLWHSPSSREQRCYIYQEDLNPSDDWVIEGNASFV
ncbi:uncharacterized protein [Elaeis guineensis]|nr:uncharacterized protein LOC105050905 isoform X2 [Elaeis guineensis]XP_010929432.1 uncharacterized protein LOC105050905 isoform X2 [Elaeis guineensis]XP_019708127.1 uncharacterized protein LOC105050905 isoform X2 [Elaeis guineensis]XP_029122163.1 uncharacterized protein LOC105050905 isoform X2 [Elaeis guineensis]XP_029122164.1 uncharacterized protein LOC105050905 isoform X2 [Elaeis guineensis]